MYQWCYCDWKDVKSSGAENPLLHLPTLPSFSSEARVVIQNTWSWSVKSWWALQIIFWHRLNSGKELWGGLAFGMEVKMKERTKKKATVKA